MGIFNNEYRIVVGVSTQQLMKEKYTELRDAALDAILNNGSITDNLANNLVNGMRGNVMKYHEYVTKNVMNYGNGFITFNDQYIIKMDSNFQTTSYLYRHTKNFFYDDADLIELFQEETGLLDKYPYAFWTNRRDLASYMVTEYMPQFCNWNSITYEVGYYNPEINLLGNVTKVTWKPFAIGFYDTINQIIELYFEVHFADGTKQGYTYFPFFTNAMAMDKNLLSMNYIGSDGLPVSYEIDLNNPKYLKWKKLVEADFDREVKYIPTVSIRKTSVNLVDLPNSDEYKHISTGLKFLGVDIGTVTDAIMSTEDGNDPDIIDDAFIGFGINIRSTNELAIRYMFDFFRTYIARADAGRGWTDLENGIGSNNNFVSQMYTNLNMFGGDATNNYKHQIRCAWAQGKLVTGIKAALGKTTKEIIIRPNKVYDEQFYVDDSSLILCRQINANQYIEIEVRGLQFVGETYPGAFAYYYLTDVEDEGSNHIHVPLVIGLLKQYGSFEQGELFKQGLILTVYAKDVVKIPWYLSEQFLDAIQVIAIVVSIVTVNPQGATFYEFLKQLALEAIKQIIIAKILKIAIKEVANILGYDATAILIAIALIYGVYQYTFTDVTWADDLLQLAQLAQNSFNNIVMDDLAETKFESEQFNEKYNEAMKAIEEVQSTFAPKIDEIITRRFSFYFNPNETPDMFYNRTVHTGNIGVASLDDVSTFVERKLMLPKNRDFSPE